jgi:hypothetical protein
MQTGRFFHETNFLQTDVKARYGTTPFPNNMQRYFSWFQELLFFKFTVFESIPARS